MRTFRLIPSVIALICMLSLSSIASAQAPPAAPAAANAKAASAGYTICYGTYSVYRYYSDAFSSGSNDLRTVALAFADFLKQKYNFQGFIQCSPPGPEAEMRAYLQKQGDNARSVNAPNPLTGWVYTAPAGASSSVAAPVPPKAATPSTVPAAKTAAATTPGKPKTAPTPAKPKTSPAISANAPKAPSRPAAAPTAPAASTIHAVCWADFDPRLRYYSAVFDGTVGDYSAWMAGFQKFLAQKYRYGGSVRCNKQPSQAEAQKYWNAMVDGARGLTLGDGSKPKIIETGWRY